MERITKIDLIRAYVGIGLMSWWITWLFNHNYLITSHLKEFILDLGGIL